MEKLTTIILKPGELTGWTFSAAISDDPSLILVETADKQIGITGGPDEVSQFASSLVAAVTQAKGTGK